jgi:hypothetical protein
MTPRKPRYTVKIGLTTLDRRMTREQAMRYGESHMPQDLKRAGFDTVVCLTDPEIHGGTWLRINHGKHIPT